VDRETAFQRRWQLLAVLCLSLVLIGLDTFVLNLALPRIQHDLNVGTSALQWIVDSYALAFGGALLMAGGLADRFGRKRMLLTGLVIFGGVSLAAAFSSNGGTLIAMRALMGLGAALMMPATLAIIKDVFPVEEQGKAIGAWSGAAAIGVPLGPVISGLLIQHFWWGSVFLINVPLAAIAVVGCLLLIPESRDQNHPGLDLPGALLSVVGLVALVYGLVEAPEHGWGSPVTWASIGAGVVLLLAFVLWERKAPAPMLSMDLFAKKRYSGGALATTCVSFGLYSMLFLLTQYLQSVLGLSPEASGVRMLAIGTMMLGAPLSPKLVEMAGLKATTALGLLLCVAGLGTLAGLGVSSDGLVLTALALFGLGMGIALPAAVDGIMTSSADHQAGAGSAVADIAMQVGGSLGIAVTGSIATTLFRSSLTAPGIPAQAHGSVGAAVTAATQIGGDAGTRVLTAARDAFVHGFTGSIWIAVGVCALGGAAVAAILPRARHSGPATGETDAARAAAAAPGARS
jgi:EmrB/QacA subfamily drug resistance transporter